MALIKNKLSIPFSAGLETKNDPNQNQLNGLHVLENVIFDSPNKLQKRNGYSIVNTKLVDNSEIEDIRFLSNFYDELGLFTGTNYYSYSTSLDKWTDKGQVFTAVPRSEIILKNEKEQKNLDSIVVENIAAFVYEDSSGVRITITDTQNNSILAGNLLISASGSVPRLANIQNILHIFYADGTNLNYKTINILDPLTISSEQLFANDLESTDKNFDCVNITNKIMVAYNSSDGGGSITLASLNAAGNISSAANVTGEDASNCISLATDSNNRVLVTYSTGSEVKALIYSLNLGTQIVAPTIIESISNVVNSTIIKNSNDDYTIIYEVSNANPKNHLLKINTIDMAASVGTPSVLKRSVGLASKSFVYDSKIYIAAIHQSALQSTYFLIDENSNIISQFSKNVGGKLATENVITKVNEKTDGTFLLASQIKGKLTIDDDTFFSLLGVNSITLDFNIDDPFQNESLGPNLHIAGGFPMMYDGNEIVEHGFHIFPEDLEDDGTSSTGGFLSDGDYQYAAVYSWTDNKGLQHRSAPSIGLPITLSAGTSTQQQSIAIPTLRLTQKSNVTVELYRTEAAGTIFYKVSDTSAPDLNDPTVDSITIVDTISDTDLLNREVLYTTGGVLDNIMAPSCSIIESHSDRIFIAGLEDENMLQYSKIRFEGFPVEFNDALTINVNPKGGPITALKSMDDKLIIFKENSIFYMSGDGPNNIGQQDTFIKPELVSSDIGCININSVVLMPEGLMFKSKKGIYLLSRALQLSYIGSNVERFNDLKITSALVVAEENQIRFTTNNGDTLVYNYFIRDWASFSNHRSLSAVVIDFDYYYLRNDGILYKEDENSFTDNGSPINIKLESNWLSFANVQGFQRVYKLLLLGNFKSPHKLRVRIAYDFNEAFTQEVVIDTSDFTDNNRYGDYSPYGNPTTVAYGGDGNVHQLRINLKRQKCQSIKVRIEEIQHDDNNLGEGLSLSNIMFEVGEKMGVNKVDTARKYGTN